MQASADLTCCFAPPFDVHAEPLKVILNVIRPVRLLSPEKLLPLIISPNVTFLGGRFSSGRATKPANRILRLRTVVPAPSESVLEKRVGVG